MTPVEIANSVYIANVLFERYGYSTRLREDQWSEFAATIRSASRADFTDVRPFDWHGETVYATHWITDGDNEHYVILDPNVARESIDLAAALGERIWHDGYGQQRVGYSQNEIQRPDPECIHNLEPDTVKVFFFQGGYYADMRRCRKCAGFVSADMAYHPKGRHEWGPSDHEGLCKCDHCDIKRSVMPIMAMC